ncbi:phage fiber-tail adaptor protein [Nocardia otitidiscaviarum]|uniref:phage fiber-tail adaptor protein n=1 Tax=Nocardia otitidiscaviarum TaxID=1823 RepID=UPI0005BBCA1A|nr:hypothetical protein [Nocardia otitidiscaviarum]
MLFKPILKDPGAALDYKFDWGSDTHRGLAWLQPGETIAARTVTADAGIVKEWDEITDAGKSVTVFLSGGTAGTQYTVTCSITTNLSRTDVRRMTIDVRER